MAPPKEVSSDLGLEFSISFYRYIESFNFWQHHQTRRVYIAGTFTTVEKVSANRIAKMGRHEFEKSGLQNTFFIESGFHHPYYKSATVCFFSKVFQPRILTDETQIYEPQSLEYYFFIFY